MKKFLLIIFSIFCTLASFSQNGGNSPENPNLLISWVATLQNNVNVIRVTNKLNCESDITLMYNGNRTKTVAALSSDTFHVVLYQTCVVMARSNPSCNQPNYGNVELNLCTILPIKLKYLNILKLSENEFQIVFEIEEPTKLKILNIQLSRGNNKFETIELMLGNDIKPNNIIRKKIKL